MYKKYLVLIICVIIIIGLISFLVFKKSQQKALPLPSTLQNQNPANLTRTNQKKNSVSTATLKPLSGSPKEVAKQFYTYYFSTVENPLARGQYKTNPYLSEDLKNLLESGYNNGNAPLFCPQNKRSNIVVGKEVQVYYNNQYLREETISEASPGTKDLYTVMLVNNGGKWLIEDVNCIY